MIEKQVVIRWLATRDYVQTWEAMRHFTNSRNADTPDEIWLLEHFPVFTQGQNGKAEHVLDPGPIPIVQTDRGGQVTYHGPGQLMLYSLIDIRRKHLYVRDFVTLLETTVVEFLASHDIKAYPKREAPGVYVKNKHGQEVKICSIGLRIRKGCSYHGIAFNIGMGLEPFARINPCGFSQLKMGQLADFMENPSVFTAGKQLVNYLIKKLVYTRCTWVNE